MCRIVKTLDEQAIDHDCEKWQDIYDFESAIDEQDYIDHIGPMQLYYFQHWWQHMKLCRRDQRNTFYYI